MSHASRPTSLVARILAEAFDAALEDLEPRRLMANDPLAVGTYGTGTSAWLNVVGTANADAIVVAQPIKGTFTVTNGTWTVTKKGAFIGVRVLAGAGNDSVSLGGGVAVNTSLLGEAGDDTIVGGAASDKIWGGVGSDSMSGAAAADSILGDVGDDTILGGAGNDCLAGAWGNDSVNGGDDNDTIDGGLNNDSVDGGAGNDKILADLGADAYAGGAGVDVLDYAGRNFALSISLDGAANDGATGEGDNVGAGIEAIVGGNANDLIVGDANPNVLNGGIGNDTVRGGGGDDRVYGGVGNDSLEGGTGDDTVYGQNDNDALYGNDGADLLEGGAGNDRLDGGADRDQLIAIGGGILDTVTGGLGLDSFWLDSDASETITDASAQETAARAAHRVKAFVKAGAAVVSKEIAYQKLADPVGTGKLVNFANNKLFADAGPTEDDIAQGAVGDCWYLSGLAAIAKTMPEVLRQAITALGDGTFAVRFGPAGAEKYVRVDADLFTYSWSATTQTYALTGAEGSIWAPILEKALTWVRGSRLGNYATISAGWMAETNNFLGLTSTGFDKNGSSSVSTMIDWLKTQLNAGKATTFGTQGTTIAGSRLIGSHAYTVDRVIDNGDGTFSVEVRNPWGVDGSGSDGANDGHLILSAATLYANTTGLVAAA